MLVIICMTMVLSGAIMLLQGVLAVMDVSIRLFTTDAPPKVKAKRDRVEELIDELKSVQDDMSLIIETEEEVMNYA